SDETIMNIVTDALRRMLGFTAEQTPEVFRIFRHRRAIPQYEADSEQRLQQIIALEEQYPGLTIAGNLKDGVGLANRIWQGTHVEDLHKLTLTSL
ncbi:MAG: protoporphyrinogen oxidase, partial [Bacteroidales bacterium]|nr:protoporphyrinogen oxidase [Bacteroidales bacterium]